MKDVHEIARSVQNPKDNSPMSCRLVENEVIANREAPNACDLSRPPTMRKPLSSFRRKTESSLFRIFRTPAFAGVTARADRVFLKSPALREAPHVDAQVLSWSPNFWKIRDALAGTFQPPKDHTGSRRAISRNVSDNSFEVIASRRREPETAHFYSLRLSRTCCSSSRKRSSPSIASPRSISSRAR